MSKKTAFVKAFITSLFSERLIYTFLNLRNFPLKLMLKDIYRISTLCLSQDSWDMDEYLSGSNFNKIFIDNALLPALIIC